MIGEIQEINTALVGATREEAESLLRVMDMWANICDQIRKDNPVWEKEMPEYGDLFTLEDFKESCLSGAFIDYDGHGDLCTETQCSGITIKPSDILFNKYIPDWCTHIMWYNR